MIRGLLLMLVLFAPTIVLAEDFENPDQVWPTERQAALEDHSWQAPYNTARVALAADRPDLAAALLVIAHQHDVLAEAPVEGLRQLEVPLSTTRQEMLGPFAFSQVLTHLLLFIGALTITGALVLRPPRLGIWLAGGCFLTSLGLPAAIGRSILVTEYSAVTTQATLVDNAGWPLADLPVGTLLRHDVAPQHNETNQLVPVTALIPQQSGSSGTTITREQFGYLPPAAWMIPETLEK